MVVTEQNLASAASATTPVSDKRGFALLVLLVGVVGTIVSAAGSWIPSLWGDEAASVMSAERSIPSLLSMVGTVDAVHGTYYLALHGWIELVGTSPFAMRLPSAVAIGATVATVMVITARLSNHRVAIVAGIICAVLPRLTVVGTEVRSYAFSALISALITLIFIEILRRGRLCRQLWIAYGALLAVGIYVFLYLALLVIVHGLLLLSTRASKKLVVSWLRTCGIAILAAAPVVVAAVFERGQVAYLGARPMVTPLSIFVTPWFGEIIFALVAWLLIAVALAAFWKRNGVTRRRTEGLPPLEIVAAAWLLVPAMVLIGGYFLVPVYTPRYLSYCAPAAAILMAIGLDHLARRRARVAAIGAVALVVIVAPSYLSQRQPYAKNNSDWSVVSEIVGTHARAGDAVVFDESTRPSRRPRLAMHTYPAGFQNLADVTLRTPYDEGTSWHDTAYSVAAAGSLGRFDGVSRVWVIEYSNASAADDYGLAELKDLGFAEATSFSTHHSMIYQYVRTRP